MDEMIARHTKEVADMEEEIKAMLAGVKKSKKAEMESKATQMRFDMRFRHSDEVDELELQESVDGVNVGDEGEGAESVKVKATTASATKDKSDASDNSNELSQKEIEQQKVLAKKAKAQAKKQKQKVKEQERDAEKEQILKEAGPSSKDIELTKINSKLLIENAKVRSIIADGHCMYRAIEDQLRMTGTNTDASFLELRTMAAEYLHEHREEYEPFLGTETDDQFETYCSRVASPSLAEWGGHVELRVLASCMHCKIMIYSADSAVLTIEPDATDSGSSVFATIVPILKLSYHRHYYALGEHYNSVVSLDAPDVV